MPWYWILIILSAIVGPFEAMYALNKARQAREERLKREKERENDGAGSGIHGPASADDRPAGGPGEREAGRGDDPVV